MLLRYLASTIGTIKASAASVSSFLISFFLPPLPCLKKKHFHATGALLFFPTAMIHRLAFNAGPRLQSLKTDHNGPLPPWMTATLWIPTFNDSSFATFSLAFPIYSPIQLIPVVGGTDHIGPLPPWTIAIFWTPAFTD
jgi:hypothetical protein